MISIARASAGTPWCLAFLFAGASCSGGGAEGERCATDTGVDSGSTMLFDAFADAPQSIDVGGAVDARVPEDTAVDEVALDAGLNVRIGARRLVSLGARTPIARVFENGDVALATIGNVLSRDHGATWAPLRTGYLSGSWQLVIETGAVVRAFAPGGAVADGCAAGSETWLCWNGTAFVGSSQDYATNFGAASGARRPFRVSMPGDSTALWSVHEAHSIGGVTQLVVWRYERSTGMWRGAMGTRSLISTHLLRATDATDTQFSYVSEIASSSTAPPIEEGALPLYYAADPALLPQSDGSLLVALRTSADDDDGYRPLDPSAVFSSAEASFSDLGEVFAGRFAVSGVFSPALNPDLYYRGSVEVPPLLIARSTDRGATWTRRLHTSGGVFPSLAEDPDSGVVVLAYGGLRFPRRGYAIEFSEDGGNSFSHRIVLPDESDGYTSGTVRVLHVAPREFILFYDVLPGYIQPRVDSYRVYARTIRVD